MLLVIDKSIAMNEGIVVDGGQALNDKRMLASLLIISPLTKKFHNRGKCTGANGPVAESTQNEGKILCSSC